MKNKTFLANCALVLCAVIWGMNFIFQKQASQHLGAFTFISLRYYLGVLSLLPLFFYMRRRKALAALEAGEEVERWHGRRFWLAATSKTPPEGGETLGKGLACGAQITELQHFGYYGG